MVDGERIVIVTLERRHRFLTFSVLLLFATAVEMVGMHFEPRTSASRAVELIGALGCIAIGSVLLVTSLRSMWRP